LPHFEAFSQLDENNNLLIARNRDKFCCHSLAFIFRQQARCFEKSAKLDGCFLKETSIWLCCSVKRPSFLSWIFQPKPNWRNRDNCTR